MSSSCKTVLAAPGPDVVVTWVTPQRCPIAGGLCCRGRYHETKFRVNRFQDCRAARHVMLLKRANPQFSVSCQRVGSGMSTFCIELRRSARLPVVADFSLCAFLSAHRKSKPHRLKSLCDNWKSRPSAPKGEFKMQALRHG